MRLVNILYVLIQTQKYKYHMLSLICGFYLLIVKYVYLGYNAGFPWVESSVLPKKGEKGQE